MTSQGSALSRFRRALATRNLLLIRAAAAELHRVGLADAAVICAILREREPHRAEAAAVRWLARLCSEQPGTSLNDVCVAARALRALEEDEAAALRVLGQLADGRR